MLDLVSVVIPAYNRASTIGYCLKSVLSQTYQDIEVIVVDDGSTDDTRKVLAGFQDSRIKVVAHETSKGAQAARNTGIRTAKGRWIAFQDSDDEWLPERVQTQLQVINRLGGDERVVVYADMYRFTPKTGCRECWSLPRVDGEGGYRAVLQSPGPVFQTMLVSKSALLEIGLLDEAVPSYQEWDTAIRLAKICRFEHIREPLAVYWLHAGETISKSGRREVDGYRYVIEKHREEILRVAGLDVWQRHLAGLAHRCGQYGLFEQAQAVLKNMPWFSALKWRTMAHLFCFAHGLRGGSRD